MWIIAQDFCLPLSLHLSIHASSPARPGAQPVQMGGPNQSPLLSHAFQFLLFHLPPFLYSLSLFWGGLSSLLFSTKMFVSLLIVWPWHEIFYISFSVFVPATALTHLSQCFSTIFLHFSWFSPSLVKQGGIMQHLTSGFRYKFLSQHLQCTLDWWNPLFQLFPLPAENGGKCQQLGATTSV